MRILSVIRDGNTKNNHTPDESWTLTRPGNVYCMQADFALEKLKPANGKCLVVGSPLFEAMELSDSGWEVTYVNVRTPPPVFTCKTLISDATEICFSEEFDAASSTCVLCHAGMGRYGDLTVENGDERVLSNVYRALKSGAFFAAGFGPVHGDEKTVLRENWHRCYSLPDARAISRAAGFEIIEEKILDGALFRWKDKPSDLMWDLDYLSILLRKP